MAPAKRYEGVPNRIFGLKCSQLRTYKMRDVLSHFRKRCRKSSDKQTLLKRLWTLEDEVNSAEHDAIYQWMSVKSSTPDRLTKLLNSCRKETADTEQEMVYNPPPPPETECSVCLESLYLDSFPQQKITPHCNHEPTVCRACLTQSLNSQIPDVAWDQVGCPECLETLPYDVVKDWASPEAFEKYDRKSLLAAFREMPNFTMCLGPGCDSGQIHETGDDHPIMTCNMCNFKTCFTHKMPWHSTQTCREYDVIRKERMEQEAASEKLISETAKKCPNPECGHGITKNGGCDHMRCRQCNYEFCYVCLAPWKMVMREGNTAHARSCKYHSDQLNVGEEPGIEPIPLEIDFDQIHGIPFDEL